MKPFACLLLATSIAWCAVSNDKPFTAPASHIEPYTDRIQFC